MDFSMIFFLFVDEIIWISHLPIGEIQYNGGGTQMGCLYLCCILTVFVLCFDCICVVF